MTAHVIPADPVHYLTAWAARAEAEIQISYACVIHGTVDGTVIETSAANTNGIGFLKSDSILTIAAQLALAVGSKIIAIGDPVEVFYTGIVWGVASAAIGKNIRVGTAAAGKLAVATDRYVGTTMAASAANNELVPVRVEIGTAATI